MVKIRSPKVGEFMRFINENPFVTRSEVIDNFITISQDGEKREKMGLRKFSGHWATTYCYYDPVNPYKPVKKWIGPRSEASSCLSYLLYFYNSHLLEGSRHLKGPAQVRYVPREDGKWGYVLTPAGMGSLANWLATQG